MSTFSEFGEYTVTLLGFWRILFRVSHVPRLVLPGAQVWLCPNDLEIDANQVNLDRVFNTLDLVSAPRDHTDLIPSSLFVYSSLKVLTLQSALLLRCQCSRASDWVLLTHSLFPSEFWEFKLFPVSFWSLLVIPFISLQPSHVSLFISSSSLCWASFNHLVLSWNYVALLSFVSPSCFC